MFMSKSLFALCFVFLSLYLNQEVSAGKKGKIDEDEVDFPTGISKSIHKDPPTRKKKGAVVDFQSILAKPMKFPTPKALERKKRLQRTFWEYALQIENEGKNFQKALAS
jgi:hypothetical protein